MYEFILKLKSLITIFTGHTDSIIFIFLHEIILTAKLLINYWDYLS